MTSGLVSYLSGVIFALGLAVGGMTQPAKVIGFLDFAGNWDPSLAFVMLGAIGIHSLFYRTIRNRPSPLFSPGFFLPNRTDIEPRLIGGSIIFGLGWGLAGLCPGPALTSLGSGKSAAVIFALAMITGIFVFERIRVLSGGRVPANKPGGDVPTEK